MSENRQYTEAEVRLMRAQADADYERAVRDAKDRRDRVIATARADAEAKVEKEKRAVDARAAALKSVEIAANRDREEAIAAAEAAYSTRIAEPSNALALARKKLADKRKEIEPSTLEQVGAAEDHFKEETSTVRRDYDKRTQAIRVLESSAGVRR